MQITKRRAKSNSSRITFVLAVAVAAAGCSEQAADRGALVADQFAIEWTVLDNYQDGLNSFKSSLTITNNGSTQLESTGWALYFSFVRPVFEETVSPEVEIRHINGDFHKLTPTAAFGRLGRGEQITVTFDASYSVAKASEAPAGYYFVFEEDGRAQAVTDVSVGPFESERQWNRHEGDKVPVLTPQTRYAANQNVSALPSGSFGRVVPTPVRSSYGQDSLWLTGPLTLFAPGGLRDEAEYLAEMLGEQIGIETQISDRRESAHQIAIRVNTGMSMSTEGCSQGEAYRLSIDPESGILIDGIDAAGVFRGIQTLLLLVDPWMYAGGSETVVLQETLIEDCPRFRYRGLMVDVSRSFHSKEQLMKVMDFMVLYKLNRLHLHLADDEGWRFEVEGLPELTEIGSRRGHTENERDRLIPSYGSGPDPDSSTGSGYYTRADFVELLRYAARRHIQVIPEVDLPGHARAAIVSMKERHRRLLEVGRTDDATHYLLSEAGDVSTYRSAQNWNDNVINVCSPAAYRFVEAVVHALDAMYEEADLNMRVVHFGGDEVPEGAWQGSPMCQALLDADPDLEGAEALTGYFFKKVVELLKERELFAAGWEEIALGETVDGQYQREALRSSIKDRVVPYVWNSVWGWGGEENGYRLANAGFPVVLANVTNLYFDLAYEKHPAEPGYMWGGFVDTRKSFEFVPLDYYKSAYISLMGDSIDARATYGDALRLSEDGRLNVLGLQAQIWGEKGRNTQELEYLVFPKLLGLAERAWAPQPNWALLEDQSDRLYWLNEDWNRFANRLGSLELVRLGFFRGGVGFRIPPPGAVIEDGTLRANVAFPGLPIRYTTDGTDPDSASTLYTGPVEGIRRARIRAFDATGRGGRIVETGGG